MIGDWGREKKRGRTFDWSLRKEGPLLMGEDEDASSTEQSVSSSGVCLMRSLLLKCCWRSRF